MEVARAGRHGHAARRLRAAIRRGLAVAFPTSSPAKWLALAAASAGFLRAALAPAQQPRRLPWGKFSGIIDQWWRPRPGNCVRQRAGRWQPGCRSVLTSHAPKAGHAGRAGSGMLALKPSNSKPPRALQPNQRSQSTCSPEPRLAPLLNQGSQSAIPFADLSLHNSPTLRCIPSTCHWFRTGALPGSRPICPADGRRRHS